MAYRFSFHAVPKLFSAAKASCFVVRVTVVFLQNDIGGMEMKFFTLIALTAALISFPTFAAIDCNQADDQATMNQCASDQLREADEQLNSNYKEIEKRLAGDPDAKHLLLSSQRAWIKFRDAECDFSSSSTIGGSIHPMMLASCRAQLTTDRNEQLEKYLSCPEGDLTCTVPSGE
ncbi:lysozyme inhibitor LprI family protein [Brucellaceae bacterium C25G]